MSLLLSRVKQLEEAIKAHRSQKADDRCIEDDDRLYEALGDGIKCDRRVGSPDAMLRNCKRFILQRCEKGGPWASYADLEATLRGVLYAIRHGDADLTNILKRAEALVNLVEVEVSDGKS